MEINNIKTNILTIETTITGLTSEDIFLQNEINDIKAVNTIQDTKILNLETNFASKTYVDNINDNLTTLINGNNSIDANQTTLINLLQNEDTTNDLLITAIQNLDNVQNIRLDNIETIQTTHASEITNNFNSLTIPQSNLNLKNDINIINTTLTNKISTITGSTNINVTSGNDPTISITGIIPINNGGLGINFLPPINAFLCGDTIGSGYHHKNLAVDNNLNLTYLGNNFSITTVQDIQPTSTPTFSNIISSNTPINNLDCVNKQYCDLKVASVAGTANIVTSGTATNRIINSTKHNNNKPTNF